MKVWKFARTQVACATAGLLAACAQAPKPLYNWEAYQPAVYAYLKDEDAAAHIEALERNVEMARANNDALPPGFHAHLGMLYLHMGQADKAAEQIQAEKLAFPEGSGFMDFLLRNTAGVQTDTAAPATQHDVAKER